MLIICQKDNKGIIAELVGDRMLKIHKRKLDVHPIIITVTGDNYDLIATCTICGEPQHIECVNGKIVTDNLKLIEGERKDGDKKEGDGKEGKEGNPEGGAGSSGDGGKGGGDSNSNGGSESGNDDGTGNDGTGGGNDSGGTSGESGEEES